MSEDKVEVVLDYDYLDTEQSGRFREQVANLMNRKPLTDVTLDFQKVNNIDSSCIVVLVEMYQELDKQDLTLNLINLSQPAYERMCITQLEKIIPSKMRKR